MSDDVRSLLDVLDGAEQRLRDGAAAAAPAYPTGFDPLDTYLSGGLRGGELTLIGGAQGLGKTTLALQIARNHLIAGGRVLVFSFEHDGQALLERLLAIEIAECGEGLGLPIRQLRQVMDENDASRDLSARLAGSPAGLAGLAVVRTYADRAILHRSGRGTGLDELRRVIGEEIGRAEKPPLVIIDYLQKLHDRRAGSESERTAAVVEDLKDLALETGAPVLAVVAADFEGIRDGSRLRIHHLRGSSALAYEPDVVLLLNDKYDVVAHHHLTFDSGNADRFHDYVVLTIAKNRSGPDRVDLEFRKRLDEGRFETAGRKVAEKLVDSRIDV